VSERKIEWGRDDHKPSARIIDDGKGVLFNNIDYVQFEDDPLMERAGYQVPMWVIQMLAGYRHDG